MDCSRLRSSGFIPPPIAPRHHPPPNLRPTTVIVRSVLPLLPPRRLFSSPPSSLPHRSSSPLPLLKSPRRRSGPSKPAGLSRARRSDDGDPSTAVPASPGKIFVEEVIGAEYGEGFETFRMDGPLKMDVDFLNDKLQECFLQRIRHAMKPDEAFGVIFSWDNVVVDTRSMKLDVWRQLAVEEGRDLPTDIHVQRNMLYATPDHVLRKVLSWESEKLDLERLKTRLLQLYHEKFRKLSQPVHGLTDWLDALYTSSIPCAIVSSLDRKNMLGALERMGLRKYFQAFVSEEDGMESIAHRFLSAAVKLNRKPAKCIVFEDDPRGIAAAHNCTMMAVALIGAHPAYELVQADLAIGRFSELSVINLRRLFGNKGSNFMDLQKQNADKAPRRRKLTIASDPLSL